MDVYSMIEYFSDSFYDSLDFVILSFRTALGFCLFLLTLIFPIVFIGYCICYLCSCIRERVNKKNGTAGKKE